MFTPGLELGRQFYQEAVQPLLEAEFPELPHSAALLGRGSEVLGFDDEMSKDHNWEPRVLLFLRDEDHAHHGASVAETLRRGLPARFRDHPTDHEICTLRGYFLEQLEFDIDGEIEAPDWLTFPEQRLGMVSAGAIYHDAVGLEAVRDRFAYYPRDVWRYLLLAGWWRIHPEANLVGRTGFVGDELGSTLIGSRLVHDLVRLCFLMERRYAPIFEVVRDGLLSVGLCHRTVARSGKGAPCRDVVGTRGRSDGGVRGSRGHAQRVAHHRNRLD